MARVVSNNWEKEVDRLLQEGQGAQARMALVSLASARRTIGEEHWARAERRIHTAIEVVMGRVLKNDDLLLRAGEDTYMVLIRSGNVDHAAEMIKRGCDSLATLFFGEGSLGTIGFEAEITEVVPPGSGRTPRRLGVQGTSDQAAAAAAGSRTEIEAANIAEAEARRKSEAARGLDERTSSVFDAEFDFMPVWDARHGVMSTYAVGVWQESQGQGRREIYERWSHHDDDECFFQYDIQALEKSVAAFEALKAAGHAALFVSPVHFRTLQSVAGRKAFMEAARRIPPEFRKFMGIRLIGIPGDMSPNLLADRVGPLRNFFGKTTLVLSEWGNDERVLVKAQNVTSVVVNLPDVANRRVDLLHRIEAIRTEVPRGKRELVIGGVVNAYEAELARDAGADFIAGPQVGPLLKEAPPAFRCSIEGLPIRGRPQEMAVLTRA